MDVPSPVVYSFAQHLRCSRPKMMQETVAHVMPIVKIQHPIAWTRSTPIQDYTAIGEPNMHLTYQTIYPSITWVSSLDRLVSPFNSAQQRVSTEAVQLTVVQHGTIKAPDQSHSSTATPKQWEWMRTQQTVVVSPQPTAATTAHHHTVIAESVRSSMVLPTFRVMVTLL